MLDAMKYYRLSRWFHLRGMNFPAKIIQRLIFTFFNSVIPYTCEIGEGSTFGYGGIALVIHNRAKIGKNCMIGQGVTIGGRSKKYNVPVIGDNVYIAAGARVLGDVVIGNDVVIGANAVVLKSIGSNTAVAGVPARVIKQGIKMTDLV
jgi:serine O-acetyltransferase